MIANTVVETTKMLIVIGKVEFVAVGRMVWAVPDHTMFMNCSAHPQRCVCRCKVYILRVIKRKESYS